MKMFLLFAFAFLLSVLIAVIFCFLWKMETHKSAKLEKALRTEEAWTARLKKRCELLESEISAKEKNQAVTNERLKMLHSGNSFDNALSILQKQ
jgi:hypothetical protein